MLTTPLAALAAGVIALAASALPVSASAAAPKRLKVDAVAGGTRLLGVADVKTLAMATADGAVVLHDDTGARRTLPARGGCSPSATGAGLIAWSCRGTDLAAFTVLITDLAGLERGRVAVRADTHDSGALAVGAQWVEYLQPDPDGKFPPRGWVNWHTSELMTIDATATATWPDLDAPGLVASYCRGVRAEAFLPSPGDVAPAAARPVQFRAPWAIVDTRRGIPDPSNPVRHRVLRCGSGHALEVPDSLTRAAAVTLGDGWVAWTPRGGNGATHLMRLTDRRRYMVRARGRALFTAGRLWVVATNGAKLSRATLPRR
jgi:hypothetical protein